MLTKVLACLVPVLFITFFIALVLPNEATSGLSTYAYTIIAVPIFCIQVGVVWFFVSSLHNYQQKLRVAYGLLSAGILLLGIAQLQLPVIIGLGLLNSWWISDGFVLVPFALSTLAVYLSGWQMARALGAPSFRVPPYGVIAGVIVMCVASSALPHLRITYTPEAELGFDAFVALTVWMLSFNTLAAILYNRVKNIIGNMYAGAMRWLLAAIILAAFVSMSELVYSLLTPESLTWYTKYGLNLVPLLMTCVVLLCAGASFKVIAEKSLAADADPIDVIVYMAQLVSEPKNIDDSLDSLRAITVRVADQSTMHLNPADEKTLVDLYLTIEGYLTTQEPMRKFSKEELRAILPRSFDVLIARYGNVKA